MSQEYVKQIDGAYIVAGTGVSLDSVVYAFHRGAAPESIQRSFPSLTLEQIYGAITFYLSHQEEVDQYLLEGEKEFERLDKTSRKEHADWYDKLDRARKEALTSQS